MLWFFLRRLGLLIVALAVASVIIFALLRLLPGDLAGVIGGVNSSPEQIAKIRENLGLNRPLVTQYFEWIGGVLHGDLGRSALTNSTVTSQLGEKLTITAPLVIASTILSLFIAVPLGVYAAVRRRNADGLALSAVGQLGIAIPQFLVGIGLIAVLAGHFGLPSQASHARGGATTSGAPPARSCCRRSPSPWPRARCSCGSCGRRRSTCSIRTTSAPPAPRDSPGRGPCSPTAANASIPIVSVLGVQLASLIAGVVVIERVFNLPGVGLMLVKDVGNRDFDKVQGTILLIAVIVLVIGFLVDLTHYLIDPRLRVRA